MEPDTDLNRAFGQFVELAADLAAGGHYEVTYHALMAAVHCAEDAQNTANLSEVAGLLRRQREVVDAKTPPHKLATQSAHGGRSIFEMGATIAETIIKRLENQQRMDDLRHGR